MKSFLVKSYTPRSAVLGEIEARARHASDGTGVHYVRSIFARSDEICFHLLDARSAADVGEVMRASGIGAQRIVEVDDA